MSGAGGPGGSRYAIASPLRRSPPSSAHRAGTAPPALHTGGGRFFSDFAPRHHAAPVVYGSPSQVMNPESSLISMPPSTVGRNAQRYVPTPTGGVGAGAGYQQNQQYQQHNFSIATSRLDEDSFVGATSPPRVYGRTAAVGRLDLGSSPAPSLEEPPAGRKTPTRAVGQHQQQHHQMPQQQQQHRTVSPPRNRTPRAAALLVDDLSPVARVTAVSPTRRSSQGVGAFDFERSPAGGGFSSPSSIIATLQNRVAVLEADRAALVQDFESYRNRTEGLLATFQTELEWLRGAVTTAAQQQKGGAASPSRRPFPTAVDPSDATLMLEVLRQERDSAVRENQVLRDQLGRMQQLPSAASTAVHHIAVHQRPTSPPGVATTGAGRAVSPVRRGPQREPGSSTVGTAAAAPPSVEEDLQRRLAERARRFHTSE